MRPLPGLVVVLVAAASAISAASGPAAPRASTPSVADALALFDATDLSGERWTPSAFRGRVVLLDFWGTWCAPCLAELPRLGALRDAYSREDLEIVGIALEPSSRRDLVSWLNRHRIDWPQIHERRVYHGGLARLFGVRQLPFTVLVNHRGEIDALHLRGERLARRAAALVAARRLDGAARGSRP